MQVGDVVYLKSGSPRLTVLEIEDGLVDVGFFTYTTAQFQLVEDIPIECLSPQPTHKGNINEQ